MYHFLLKSPIRTDRRKGWGRVLAGEILGVIRVDVLTLAKDTGIKQKSMLVMEISSICLFQNMELC